ncbi:hypothetical protein B0H14DRAFT_2632242 [Mycena olivaceomarginata]|nr:hypothetical protein B0H14DRAFT_2632242 [Mycena olivaceomarginata]
MPGASSSSKAVRAPKLDVHRQLDPDELSDLKLENCAIVDKARTSRDRGHLVLEGRQLVNVERELSMAADRDLNPADFITAGRRLVKAARQYFEPRNQAAELSAQLAEHFERIIERADFQPNFHRYRTYSERVFQRWVVTGKKACTSGSATKTGTADGRRNISHFETKAQDIPFGKMTQVPGNRFGTTSRRVRASSRSRSPGRTVALAD